MKQCITVLCVLLTYNLQGCVVSIGIPQKLYQKDSALMIYMQDNYGQQLVAKCYLSDTNPEHIISRNELKITALPDAQHFDTIADVTDVFTQSNEVIVVQVELDCSMKVFKILIVHDSFLADNMIDVFTFPVQLSQFEDNHHAFAEFENSSLSNDSLDVLTEMAGNIDVEKFEKSIPTRKDYAAKLQECVVYAEILILMQYGRAKRAMQSWFSY